MIHQPHECNQHLEPDRVVLYCLTVPSGFGNLPLNLDRFADLLTPTERRRHDGYRVQHRRNDLVLSRVLLQTILAHHDLTASGPWRLETEEFGKPYACSSLGRAPFHLNPADTSGMIAWAIGRSGPLGCDIEALAEDLDEVAATHFAPEELADYRSRSGPEKRLRFYEIWTLKEALLKADGRGLQIPLDSFFFRFDDLEGDLNPKLEIRDSHAGPDAGPWRLFCHQPLPTHQAAVAVRAAEPVVCDLALLHLAEFDSDLQRPWVFVHADSDSQLSTRLFGRFWPGI